MSTAPSTGAKWARSRVARAFAGLHGHLWAMRSVTLGVRTVVLDQGRRVLLVRHSYTPGWYLPGGAVDRGESAETAAVRETQEETGVLCLGRPLLHGLFHNPLLKRDHVACYVVRDFEERAPRRPDLEIAEAGFFSLEALPAATTAATRRRLAEVIAGAPVARDW